jgi:hypothetical protein
MELLRERNVGGIVYFPMIKAGSNDFAQAVDWTPVAADTQFSIDGGAFANTNTLPVNEGGGMWSLTYIAGEITGKVTAIKIEDATTKAVEDQTILVQTWGDDSAGIPFNALADYILRRTFGSARTSSRGDTVSFRSLLGAVAKLVNRIYRSGSNLLITREDDSTTLGTQAMTTSGSAEQITDLDTT